MGSLLLGRRKVTPTNLEQPNYFGNSLQLYASDSPQIFEQGQIPQHKYTPKLKVSQSTNPNTKPELNTKHEQVLGNIPFESLVSAHCPDNNLQRQQSFSSLLKNENITKRILSQYFQQIQIYSREKFIKKQISRIQKSFLFPLFVYYSFARYILFLGNQEIMSPYQNKKVYDWITLAVLIECLASAIYFFPSKNPHYNLYKFPQNWKEIRKQFLKIFFWAVSFSIVSLLLFGLSNILPQFENYLAWLGIEVLLNIGIGLYELIAVKIYTGLKEKQTREISRFSLLLSFFNSGAVLTLIYKNTGSLNYQLVLSAFVVQFFVGMLLNMIFCCIQKRQFGYKEVIIFIEKNYALCYCVFPLVPEVLILCTVLIYIYKKVVEKIKAKISQTWDIDGDSQILADEVAQRFPFYNLLSLPFCTFSGPEKPILFVLTRVIVILILIGSAWRFAHMINKYKRIYDNN